MNHLKELSLDAWTIAADPDGFTDGMKSAKRIKLMDAIFLISERIDNLLKS